MYSYIISSNTQSCLLLQRKIKMSTNVYEHIKYNAVTRLYVKRFFFFQQKKKKNTHLLESFFISIIIQSTQNARHDVWKKPVGSVSENLCLSILYSTKTMSVCRTFYNQTKLSKASKQEPLCKANGEISCFILIVIMRSEAFYYAFYYP